jgi:hypothetical protein
MQTRITENYLETTETITLYRKISDSHTNCIMNDFKGKFAAAIMSIKRMLTM